MQELSTCLWFDRQAEEAAAFHVSRFPNPRVLETKRYLEGGPAFKFTPAVSQVASCDTQDEIDAPWRKP